MPSKISQLIDVLIMALDVHTEGDHMSREELADALALADAADEEHRAQVRELRADVEAAKESKRRDDETIAGWREAHREAYLTGVYLKREAERVRRGARCLRERCKRLESRARGAEERADITRTAALYAWRMLYEVEFPPFERGAWMRELYGRVATRYGTPFADAGREARAMVDVLGMWPKEEA